MALRVDFYHALQVRKEGEKKKKEKNPWLNLRELPHHPPPPPLATVARKGGDVVGFGEPDENDIKAFLVSSNREV